MTKIPLILLLLFSTIYANTFIDGFIQEQLNEQTYLVIDKNSTEYDENAILESRYTQYGDFLNTLLQEREQNLNDMGLNSKKSFYLHRKIEFNKRRGNHYAVLRDEISTLHLKVDDTLKEMLTLLISATYEKSESNYVQLLEKALQSNHAAIKRFVHNFDESLDSSDQSHEIIIQAQKNLVQLKAIIFLNNDLRQYIHVYKKSIYQASIYSSFGFSRLKKQIRDTSISKKLDPFLTSLNLNTYQFVLILLILFITLSASRVIYWIANFILNKWDYKVSEI